MNLLQLRTEVLAHGFDSTQYGTRINGYLNDAYMLVCRRVDYYIDEATQTYQTTSGQTDIALPANWARTRSLLDLDLARELQEVGLRDIDTAAQTAGTPFAYATDSASLRLYPTPDGAHNLELRYWLLPAEMAADTDTPTIPADYHRMLCDYAIGRCYWGDDDPGTGQQWDNRFATGLAQFEADQRFSSTNAPSKVRSMWGDDSSLGVGGWAPWAAGGF